MKIAHRVRTVQCISSNDKITSFSGLKFVADLSRKLGIISGLGKLTVKKLRRGISTPDFIMSFVNNFLVGGSNLTDLEVPAPTTAGEFLCKFTAGHIKQVEPVIRHALLRCAEHIGGE